MNSLERRTDRFRVSVGPRLGLRLLRAVAVSVCAALLVSGLILDGFLYFTLRATMVDDLTAQAHITADNSSAAVLFRDSEAAMQTLVGLRSSTAIQRAELLDLQGESIATYVADGAVAQRRTLAKELEGHVFADHALHLKEPVQQAGRTVGHVYLVASLQPLYRRLVSYVAITLGASVVAFAVAFVLVVRIRRELDATEQRLDDLAYFDPVTGLRNRHAANEQIERLIATVGKSSEGFALLLLDLDDFKMINDTFGHGAGDDLLRALAARLTEFMRAADIAFRFGGDEFVILCPRVIDQTHLQLLGQAAMLAFDQPLKVGSHDFHVRGSVGVAQYPLHASDAAGLVQAADTAMYEAKSLGKNIYVVFQQSMHVSAARRMRLETDLRAALRDNEFHLVYQPIIDLDTGRLVGVEALLRWIHPEFGLVSPADFIPVAEQCGLIVEIGQWVLNAACRQSKVWHDEGHRFHVAVNVSARQLRKGVMSQVEAALESSGADPRELEIELTEHSMVEDLESNVAQLAALRRLGIQVAIDDFGTGLSSLAYLKRLPISKLKIDRAFVKDLPRSADDAAIATAIISMAHRLSLRVVAEGIESAAQAQFLREHGCDFAQGYLFSRPVDPARISELADERREGFEVTALLAGVDG